MINLSIPRHALALWVSLALAAAALPVAAQAVVSTTTTLPDKGLFTIYSLGQSLQSVNWLVCGSTQQTEGCYDLGTLGKFGQVAAMIEGSAKESLVTGTATREIYVCDVAAGSSGTGVTIYDYTKTDVVNATDDAVTVILRKAIPLTLVGGANAACQMAANPAYLYISVNGGYASISKGSGNVVGQGSGEGVTSITADGPGFTDIDYSDDSFSGSAPNGSGVEYGGGNYFKVSPGVSTNLMKVPLFYGGFPAASRMKLVPTKPSAAYAVKANTSIDDNLYTDYWVFSEGSIRFSVCGATQDTQGCFGSGEFGPFKHAGSVMESRKVINGGTVTRHVYICDDAAGSGKGVTLYDYLRSDAITSSYDRTTTTLVKTLPLPLAGGANANCAMAQDLGHVFVGTQNSKTAVKVHASTYAITASAGLNPKLHFATATANSSGFTATTFGSTNSGGSVNIFGPSGNAVQSSGGAYFLLGTANGVQTESIPTTAAAASYSLMKVRFKQPAR